MKRQEEKIVEVKEIVDNLSETISYTKDINEESLVKIVENEKILSDLLIKKENNKDFEIDCEIITEITRSLVELLVLQKENNKETIEKLEVEYKKTQIINENLIKENEFLLRDQLTGLGNRHLFKKEIEPYIKKLLDGNIKSINYAIVDIDDFKKINDNHGHMIGDAVLRYFAKFLTKHLEGKGLNIYRLGGEEFIIISINKNNTILANELKTILKRLENVAIKTNKEKTTKSVDLKLSFSGGTASVSRKSEILKEARENLTDSFQIIIDHLYDIADKKLYQVKSNGKKDVL